MGNIAKYRKRKVALLTAAVVASAWMPTAWALPSGAENVKHLTISDDGKNMNVALQNDHTRGAVDWQSFSISADEKVHFSGPDAYKWMVLNRVIGNDASNIYGSLTSAPRGTIFLVNPNGILFGENSYVDVGSLVASTMDIKQADFLNMQKNTFVFSDKGNSTIQIKKGADITARDGYVAIFAHDINNAGKITAPEVAMAGGKSIELGYDDKINLVVNVSNDSKKATVDTKNNYVLMTAKDASNIIGDSIINNSGTIQVAKTITKKEDGTFELSGEGGDIDMTAAKVLVDGGTLTTNGGNITTAGYEILEVNDKATVKSTADKVAGNWNINAKNVTIEKDVSATSPAANKVSSAAVSNALSNNLNVNVTASPVREAYYSDVRVNSKVEKTAGNDVALTLSAGRNVIVDADIASKAGKLDVKLNSDVSKLTDEEKAADMTQEAVTNSRRNDGASIIRANIDTNGGNFETTGTLGTYFGVKEAKDAGATRSVKTNGGNITLGGNEVLVATGGEVLLDTTNAEGNGTVYIAGSVNSANTYTAKKQGGLTWNQANTLANEYDKEADGKTPTGNSHLAVITSGLEDAVANSTIEKDYKDTAEAYVGGHVVAVATKDGYPVDAEGNFITSTTDENGNPVIVGKPTTTDKITRGNEVITSDSGFICLLDTDKTNLELKDKDGNTIDGSRGWYKLEDGTYARFWAWTAGKEKGTIFYVQTIGENVVANGQASGRDMENVTDAEKYPEWFKAHGYALKDTHGNEYYTNFAPGEPNDDLGSSAQLALAIDYDTYKSDQRQNILYSQWDDIGQNRSSTNMTHYVVETDLANTSLNIKAGETTINGAVGNITKLNNLTINSEAKTAAPLRTMLLRVANNEIGADADTAGTNNNVTLNGSVEVLGDVDVDAKGNIAANKFIEAGGKAELKAGTDLAVNAITADTIDMIADRNVTINDKLTAKSEAKGDSIVIRAKESFRNEVKDSANALKTANESTNWKIYSDSPYKDKLGDLYSGEFAEWGTDYDSAATGTGNLYIFKYNPTLTFHVKEGGQKKLGTQMDPVGFTVRNELEGQFLYNFRDGQGGAYEQNAIFTENDLAKANLSKIHTVSDGYAADAKPGTYKIKLVYGDTGNSLTEDTQIAVGYKNKLDFSAVLMVPENTTNPPTPGPLSSDPENNPLDPAEKPQIDPLSTSNLNGSASYTTNMAQGASADRVLGLQSAELPFFNKKNGLVKLYGTYDVTVDPDKVKMEPTAKVLPEPEQEQARAQYREYDKELTTAAGTAKFRLTYNGTTLDIYPTDAASMAILTAGEGTKNVEVESQALFAAFKEMGITLDDLDGVYTHFEKA